MIPGVEHLCPKLQSGCLSPKNEGFLDTDIPVVDPGAVQNSAAAVAEVPGWGHRKTGRIEPKKSIVPYVAGEIAAVSVTNAIGQRI